MDASTLNLQPGQYWFVASIGEPSNNDLRVVVVEGKAQPDPVPSPHPLGAGFPVEPDATCKAYELIWWGYVAYSVRNESYFQQEQGEALGERLFGLRTRSAYLDYLARSTFATADYPGPLSHWFLYAEHHCLDVVSVDPPEVRELPLASVSWDLQDRAYCPDIGSNPTTACHLSETLGTSAIGARARNPCRPPPQRATSGEVAAEFGAGGGAEASQVCVGRMVAADHNRGLGIAEHGDLRL